MRTVLTLSREAGSGGDEIGYELARQLGYTCINKSFVDLIARKARVAPWQVERAERLEEVGARRPAAPLGHSIDEQHTGDLDRLIQRLGYGERLGGAEYLTALRTVMTDLAAIGNVVVIGRGGQVILRDHPDAFHVRITNSQAARAAHLGAEHKVSQTDAAATIKVVDGLRSELLRDLGCGDINNPALYDLLVQSGGKTAGECVAEIRAALESDSREKQFEPMVGRIEE